MPKQYAAERVRAVAVCTLSIDRTMYIEYIWGMEQANIQLRLRDWVREVGGVESAAGLLDCTPGLVSHIQTGRRAVSKDMAPKLIAASGGRFTLQELLYGQRAAG